MCSDRARRGFGRHVCSPDRSDVWVTGREGNYNTEPKNLINARRVKRFWMPVVEKPNYWTISGRLLNNAVSNATLALRFHVFLSPCTIWWTQVADRKRMAVCQIQWNKRSWVRIFSKRVGTSGRSFRTKSWRVDRKSTRFRSRSVFSRTFFFRVKPEWSRSGKSYFRAQMRYSNIPPPHHRVTRNGRSQWCRPVVVVRLG